MRILVVEDEKDMNRIIVKELESEGYIVDSCYDGESAFDYLCMAEYDGVILDIMIPKMDGFTVLKKVRSKGIMTPILFLSAKSDVNDIVRGLDLGADDYMVKPFLPKELLFRVNAILRRSYKAENPLVKLHDSEIDFERAEIIKNGEHISLTAKEHDILAALYRNAGRIVTIDALCEAAWGDNPFGYENSLMAHIRRIREKIEANPSQPVSLITMKGLGYKLVVEGK